MPTRSALDNEVPAVLMVVLNNELPAILMVVLVILAFIVVLLKRLCSSDNGNSFSDDDLTPLVSTAKVKERRVEVFHLKMIHKFFDGLTILLLPVIVGTMFIALWNVYLVEESVRGDCVANSDCFPKIGNYFLQQQPVKNCSVFELSDYVTYECYRPAFRYAQGLGTDAGVLFFFAILFKLYIALWVTVYDCIEDCGRCCRVIFYGLIWAGAATLLVLFIAMIDGVPLLRETVSLPITNLPYMPYRS